MEIVPVFRLGWGGKSREFSEPWCVPLYKAARSDEADVKHMRDEKNGALTHCISENLILLLEYFFYSGFYLDFALNSLYYFIETVIIFSLHLPGSFSYFKTVDSWTKSKQKACFFYKLNYTKQNIQVQKQQLKAVIWLKGTDHNLISMQKYFVVEVFQNVIAKI